MLRTTLTAQAIDEVLAGSFPASDPPAWTPGMARPAPEIAEGAASGTPQDGTNDLRASDGGCASVTVEFEGRSHATQARTWWG
jgi:hypothetical protein